MGPARIFKGTLDVVFRLLNAEYRQVYERQRGASWKRWMKDLRRSQPDEIAIHTIDNVPFLREF